MTGKNDETAAMKGSPQAERVPMSAPDIKEADIQGVADVLRSGRLSLGPKQEEFEQLMAEFVGVKHAVAVSSGTAALHLLARAFDLGLGDEVLVPSFTFAATVNCVLYQGATPVFVDIQPDTYNLDPSDMEAKITPRTKAVIPVDVFGHPADWNEIEEIARRHELAVIDDSCEALGATYRGRAIGSFGHAATFAFYANKQITTGEGGMIVTSDSRIAEKCRSWRNQGRGAMGTWLVHEELGYNYRLDEMSAALGVTQMLRLEEILAKRAAAARRYTEYLARLDWLRPPAVRDYVKPSWFVYVVTLAEGVDREALIHSLAQKGIPSRAYFPPVHLQPYFLRQQERAGANTRWDWRPGSLPVTEDISRRTLALPFHTNISPQEQELVVKGLQAAL